MIFQKVALWALPGKGNAEDLQESGIRGASRKGASGKCHCLASHCALPEKAKLPDK